MKNVAVVGCGAVSGNHIAAIRENSNTHLVAVCDIDESKGKTIAEENACKFYRDFSALLQDEEIDCAHIATPHYLHKDMAIAAMEHGKDVLVEKPLAICYIDALAIQETAQRTGRRVGVCFQNRYNATCVKARELLDSGRLGSVVGVKGLVIWNRDEAYYRQAAWRGTWAQEGGGVLINQAIHTLDMLQWFAGEVDSVCASVSTKKLADCIQVEDTADAFFRFKSGASGILFATNCYVDSTPIEVEITCEGGSVRFTDNNLLLITRQGTDVVAENDPVTGAKHYWGAGHRALINDFYDKLISGKPFALDSREGAKAIRLLDAIYRSAAIHREVVL